MPVFLRKWWLKQTIKVLEKESEAKKSSIKK